MNKQPKLQQANVSAGIDVKLMTNVLALAEQIFAQNVYRQQSMYKDTIKDRAMNAYIAAKTFYAAVAEEITREQEERTGEKAGK
jgi:hypothetical protein